MIPKCSGTQRNTTTESFDWKISRVQQTKDSRNFCDALTWKTSRSIQMMSLPLRELICTSLTRVEYASWSNRFRRYLIDSVYVVRPWWSRSMNCRGLKKLEESILNHRIKDGIKQKVTVTMHDVIRDPRKAWSRGCQNLIFEGLRE